jgi:hypothetical protein
MKAILLLLAIFTFTTSQVIAANCGTVCSFQKDIKSSNAHDCCPDKKNNKKEKSKNNCNGSMEANQCLHNNLTTDILLSSDIKITDKTVVLTELRILTLVKSVGIHHRLRQKNPNSGFIRFKAQYSIYLFQDKFLI